MDIEEYLRDLRARQERVRPKDTPSKVVYPLGEVSLGAHIEHWAAQRPDRIAIAFQGRHTTYAELADQVRRVAGRLAAAGVRPGDRVAVYLPNSPEFVVAMMAVLRLGGVHVPVNPMFQSAELAYELADSGAIVAVTQQSLLPMLDKVQDETAVREVLVTDGADWEAALAHEPAPEHPVDLDALAALNYTGGTTGLPKGCEHSQRHILYTAATCAGGTGVSPESDFVALCYIPIFWIAGEDLGILLPIVVGGTAVLMARWDPRAVLDAVETYRVTGMIGTVENYLELLEQPDIADRDLSSLEDPSAVSFIRKLTPEVRHQWAAVVGSHSLLREGAYGMTETHTFDATPYGMADDDRDLRAEPVFCGVPVPGTDIAVVSFESGEPLPIGEAGEIIVRSPSVTTGYWNKPEATASQLRDGWLHTGDNGRIGEDGCLHYLGREKDMIKVKGMSVFPAEVEMLLCQHPAVRTVAVVPAEHDDKGQQPVAFVSLEPGAEVTGQELEQWARGSMAAYKVPLVTVVDGFPLTTTGKIRKVELVDRAQALVDAD